MSKKKYKVIYRFRFKNGKIQMTSFEDVVTEYELDYIKSSKNICIISITKLDEEQEND